jgi:hypothetical protein
MTFGFARAAGVDDVVAHPASRALVMTAVNRREPIMLSP